MHDWGPSGTGALGPVTGGAVTGARSISLERKLTIRFTSSVVTAWQATCSQRDFITPSDSIKLSEQRRKWCRKSRERISCSLYPTLDPPTITSFSTACSSSDSAVVTVLVEVDASQ